MRPVSWILFGVLTGIALGLLSNVFPLAFAPIHETSDGTRWIERRK